MSSVDGPGRRFVPLLLAPVLGARGLSERMGSRGRLMTCKGGGLDKTGDLKRLFTLGEHVREATKTGLKWPFIGGCVRSMKNQG